MKIRSRRLEWLLLMHGMFFCVLIVWQGSATAQQSLHEEVNRLAQFIHDEQYNTAITEATDVMNRINRLDPALLYLRGYAEWRICDFGAAGSDLASLGDYGLNEKWPHASSLVQKIIKLRSLCPPKVQDIRLAGQVAFRVYRDDDSPWTQAIIKLLPDAFHKGQEMFDTRVYETAVFIFKDAERFTAFYRTAYDSSPGSWMWASGGNGNLFFVKLILRAISRLKMWTATISAAPSPTNTPMPSSHAFWGLRCFPPG